MNSKSKSVARAQKRFKREHRENKGVATAALYQARNERLRRARERTGYLDDVNMLLLADHIIWGRK